MAWEIPTHWNIAWVSELTNLINGYPFDSQYFVREEGVPLVRIRDLDANRGELPRSIVEDAWIDRDDVIIGMDGDFNIARWRGGRALLNQRMCCLRMSQDADERFIFYALPFPLRVINDLTYSTTVKHLSSGDVRKIRLGSPPNAEQRAIAAFLDRETASIDALVAKKEKLIELLQEQRMAQITRAVTNGLDPSAPMKDSGVEWLGDIPAHWEMKPLSQILSRITYGFTNPMPVADEGGPYMLTAFDIGDGEILFENARHTTEEAFSRALTDKSRPRRGDILLTKDGTLGRVAVASEERVCINQSVALFVRRQGFWDDGLGKIREALADRFGEVRRRAADAASDGWRWFVV
jgi:type I restriction enzyme, S subunit